MEQVMSSAFEFGLLLHTRSMLGDNDRPPSFDELWEDAAYAEQMNFDQIWLGDSVCILNRARGDCLTTMAALACKTDRIKIGTVPLIPDSAVKTYDIEGAEKKDNGSDCLG
jgi:Luciferase-like monooxygenase